MCIFLRRDGNFFKKLLLNVFLIVYILKSVDAQVLTPPYFNLAEGRRIVATATCGEGVTDPELYCKLVGADTEKEFSDDNFLVQGQFCDYCDPKNPAKRHPPEYAVDGRKTWWQSPPLSRGMSYNEVNLTIDLGQEFHVAYVIVRMGNSPRPGVWALEKSNDNGQSYSPWQYFADSIGECQNTFGINVDFEIKADDTVICTTQYSKIVPLEGGEIVVPLVQNRPSANDFFNSTVLQEWTRATNVRLRLIRVKNLLGHLMSIARQDTTTTRRYYYSIEDISIGGRCRCNGHADTCTSIDQNDPYKLVCDCKDNTGGPNCEICSPGFEQKKWSQSKTNKRFVCERCNCFGHSDQCVYNETVDNLRLSLDLQGVYDGGGVCQNCQHNTEGINCDKCVHGYYRPYGKERNDIDACRKCQCDYAYSTGNCEDGTGRCECKEEYTKPNCDSCSFGHYGYPMCRPCDCFLNGTTSLQCQVREGPQCPCKSNFGGKFCRFCAEGYFDFPDCKACECNSVGSISNVCDVKNGECKCKSSYGGRNCNECSDGYYSFPSCAYCNCDIKGTLSEVCDKKNGQCLCKPGYGGARCDLCIANFTGFPDCKPCNCSSIGSAFTVCDSTGKCTCIPNFAGKLCDQCYPGFYNYPNCTACMCNPEGSIGVTCNNAGSCQCQPNFDGDKCDECRKGFYNFPKCEECNFDPAGVISSFTGCSTFKPGQQMAIECKSHVQGKSCGECKELYWNLQTSNPEGCENCACNTSGTVGRLGSCHSKTGQCICKLSTSSRRCDQCVDGFYNLEDSNLFGCAGCECDVGGSLSNICHKKTGQCICQPRVIGRNCKLPLETYYFPTLYQYQYEIEDGITPEATPVRYGFDEAVFPGYSWRGYAVFSVLQNETYHDVSIERPSVYRMVLRYMNINNQTISGMISVSPASGSNLDTEQKFQVLFKPSKTPAFVTVAGIHGNNPSPFVMNPGSWIIKIKNEKSLFLDYFVLIPAEYYEASSLVSNVTNPCTVDDTDICRHYLYPNISSFDQKKGSSAYINDKNSRSVIQHYFDDSLKKFGEQTMPVLSDLQQKLHYDMIITRPGKHVLVVSYVTTEKQTTTTVQLEVRTQSSANKGTVTIYNCRYTMLCRAAFDNKGAVTVLDLDSNNVNIILEGKGDGIGIESITAIPLEKWSLDYVRPQPSCTRKDNKCVPSTYITPPDSKRVDFKIGNENRISKTLPSTIFDDNTELIFLDYKDAMVDINGKVSKPGPYLFIIHYYQPDFPEFEMDILIQNGQFYEAKLPVQHCPNNAGCRALIKQANGNTIFQLTENVVISVKEPNHKSIWLQYVLIIPASQYTSNILTELPFDQTSRFISQCGHNNFYLDTNEEGFCKDATFSLTMKYNHGTLPCRCDFEGSKSYECAKFGGQCPCQNNVIGRRCDSCKTGYFGFPNCQSCNCSSKTLCDPNTGECVCPKNVHGEKCNQCIQYTFGFDPIIGCQNCNCHIYGVKNNNLQCNILDGSCDCKENVEGRTCDRCSAGYWGFPLCETCECDLRGTTVDICNQTTAGCFCKENVQGSACDICKDGTFNLQPDNAEGCTKCFCFGKTSRCSSSPLFVTTISELQNWTLADINFEKSIVVKELPVPVNETDGVSVNFGLILEGITYFVAPSQFLGNRLISYGNNLNYTILYTGQDTFAITGADLVLYGANMYLLYETVELPVNSVPFDFSIKIIETNFLTLSRIPATREELMQVLQNLTAIYIKATYSDKGEITKLSNVQLEIAAQEYYPSSKIAFSVEQCHCPPNYVGLSCEECADGYYRVPNGPFGGYCVPCQCNGHTSSCDKATGICYNCKHNTKGDHCEKCEVGFYGNATIGAPNNCLICACPLPTSSNNFATGCDFNELNNKIICDCIPNYTGERCERCAPGYYGRPETIGEICLPCQCNGNIDPTEFGNCDYVTGKCIKCLNNTYGDSCERCAPGYFGDAIIAKDCQPCICDKCGTKECDHRTGRCICQEKVIGEKCDHCLEQHYGFSTCQGCTACKCDIASDSLQCDDTTGHCRCKEGVTGRTCDKCVAGYWKYTESGCTSCGCVSEYSIGVGCNTTTGLCECLPGVVGEKCDSCPYRYVLIPNEGCFGCDKCTDGLLDVTDQIRNEFIPMFNQFKTENIGYFTIQRLKYINNTYKGLSSKVGDVVSFQFDTTPYEQNISTVGNEAENIHRKIMSVYNDATNSIKKGNLAFEDVQKIESLIIKAADKSKLTVLAINHLAYGLETSAGPQIGYAVNEAQKTVQAINELDLDDEKKTQADEVHDEAERVLINVTSFSSPLNQTVRNLKEVQNKKDTLDNKLDELENLTGSAQKTAATTTALNNIHKNANLPEKVKHLKEIANDANKTTSEISELSKNMISELNVAEMNFMKLGQSNNDIKNADIRTSEIIENFKAELNSESENVNNAISHANQLENQAQILESLGKKSISSDHAIRAATSYKDIIAAFNDARKAIEVAKKNADEVNEKSQGIKDKIQMSEMKSADLKENARKALEDVQRKLKTELNSVLQLENAVSFTINQTANIDDIYRQIKDKKIWNNETTKIQNLNANDISTINLNNIQDITENLPIKLQEAKKLYENQSNEKKSILQAGNYLDSTESYVPEMNTLIENLKNKPEKLNKSIKNISETMNLLQQKILETKDLAAKIKVGVTLHPNIRASIELPIPASLLEQGSSTDLSLYFKTNQENALLLYLGNEVTRNQKRETVSPKIKRPKTDDFLAIEIKKGYLFLSIDLGERSVSTVTIDKFVSDDKWYNVRVERTGKLGNLSLTEEIKYTSKTIRTYKSSWMTSGFHSILNLDKEHSKFFIGGIPTPFEAPIEIKFNTFAGKIEELVVERIPISLWNFIDVSSPQNLKPSRMLSGAVERDVLIKTDEPTGCSFTGDGYVKLLARGYLKIDHSDVVLRFKTTALDGLLFLIFKNDMFVSIELRKGYIYYQYNVGKGIISMHTPSQYNDAKWHVIEANQFQNQGLLKVDSKTINQEKSEETIGNFELPEFIYIGGCNIDHNINEVMKIPFEGCIDGVQINGQGMDINHNLNSHGIVPGCPENFSKFVSFNDGDMGYVQWPHPSIKANFFNKDNVELSLRIKTKAKDGLIVFGLDGMTSFYLLLMDGGIIFKMGSQEVNTGSNTKYNDDRWHAIMAFHDSNSFHLLIDDFDMFKSSEFSSRTKFMFPGKLYFGSVPVDVDSSAAYEKAFVGCIGDATLNGIVINFEEIAEGKDAAIGRCSGPGQLIGPLTKPGIVTKAPPVDITPGTPSVSIMESSVTAAPGCLPMEPAVDRDLTKESGYRFGTVNHSAQTYNFDQLQFKDDLKLSVDMKTISENGIIFYVTQPQKNDFFALYLKDSNLYFKYNCSSNSASLNSDVIVNQGEWHNIQIEVNQNQGRLIIDGYKVNTSSIGCRSINIGSPFYLGGMDSITIETAKKHLEKFNKTFVGCLRNFKQNGKSSENPSTSTGVIPCSSKVEPGTFFSAKGGFVKTYETFKVGKQIEIKMEIKPRNNSGLLMAVHSKKDYLVLQMIEGAIKFTVENGNGPVSNLFRPPSPFYFCDNQWHKIIAAKNKNVIILKVDEQQTPISMDSGANTATDTNSPLYVGGYPSTLAKSKGIEVNPQFVGCIKNLEINNKEEQLSSYTAYQNVMFNVCPTI